MRTPAASLAILLAAASIPALQAQLVELAPSTTPSQLQPSITDASVTVTRGLPANITASQLLARLWQGSQYVWMPITSITAIGTRKVLRFHVPSIMDANRVLATQPYATKVEIVNALSGPTITTVIAANTVLLPAPAIDMVWQPYGDRGTSVDVTIKGFYTNFPATLTAITMDFGAGVTAIPKACSSGVSPTQVCATVTVSPTATPGLRNVAVTYGGITTSLANGFAVTVAGPHLLQAVGETHIRQGQNGVFSFRLDGASIPDPAAVQLRFGAGVSHDVPYQFGSYGGDVVWTAMVADLLAATGPRNAVAIANGEMYIGAGILIVDPSPSIITSLTPNQAPQGASMSVRIQGQFTGFLQNMMSVSMGAGISISNVDVVGPDLAYAQINVSPTATPGARAVSVVTQGQSPLAGAFQVTPGIPGICGVTPAMVRQGGTAKVALQFCFVTPAEPLTVTFPGGGVTAVVSTVSGSSALVSITADASATPGVRNGLVEFGGRKYPFEFTVLDNTPRLLSACREPGCQSPPVLSPGDRFNLRITGWNTNFVQGQVQVSVRFSQGWRQTLPATVLSPTELLAQVVEAGPIVAGTYPIDVVDAGGGTLTFDGMKVSTPPVLMVSPAVGGVQGSTVPVTFTITNGTIPATCPAFTARGGQPSGITCQNYSIVSPNQATATFVIDPLTPVGGRISVPVGGSSASFNIRASGAALNIKDYAGYPGSNTDLVLNGVGTHWCTTCPSPTKLSITGLRGQQLTISNFTVVSPILATARVSGMADPGGYTISMQTAGEVAARANSFEVLPAAPTIRLFLGESLTPNPISGQGQVWNVYCTYVDGRLASIGSLTARFAPVQFSVEDPGPGILIDRIAAASADPPSYLDLGISFGFKVTYRLTVSPTAPIGARTLWMRWNGMLTPALFTVTGLTPVLTQASPGSLPQGSTNFQVILTGKDTAWQQGSSVVDFGPGITVLNTAVDTPASIRTGITIDPIASIGPRTVTVTTGAQTVSATALFSVSASPAAVSALQPSGGAAGATLDVSVTGSQSNFRQGLTSANFGAGVTVNSVQVSSLTQAVANITIAANAVLGTRTVVLTTGGESAATVPNAFQVTPGLPVISSISPPGGPANQTLSNIQVSGLNLTGATFSVGGTQTLPGIGADPPILTGATVLAVTNLTDTSATLQIQFGAATGAYPLIAANGSGASSSWLTPANQLSIYVGGGYAAASTVTIVNSTPTALDPLRVTPRSATGEPVTVINSQPTVLDPPSRTANYATSASVTVVNSQFTALDPLVRTTRYAGSNAVTVLNAQPTSLDLAVKTPRYAASYSVNVRNQSAPPIAPSAMTAEAGNRGSQGPVGSSDAQAEEETAFAGQALRIQVEVPAGVQTKGVNIYVNGARLADPLVAPYETLLTVPSNVPDLEIKAVVLTGEGEFVAPLRHVKVLPEPEARRVVAIDVRDAEDREVRDAEVTFRYFGFAAEHFRFAQPLARTPEEDPGKDRKPDVTGFAAVLHYPPDGADPLGTGAVRDTVSRYRSSLQIAETSVYEFRLRASSGASLRIAGEPVAEEQRITLEAGSEVALEVLHYRGIDPAAALHLEWRMVGPNQEFQTIAPEFLRAPPVPASLAVPWAVSQLDAVAVTRGAGGKGQVRSVSLAGRQRQQPTILIRVVPQRQEPSRGTNHEATDSNRQQEEE